MLFWTVHFEKALYIVQCTTLECQLRQVQMIGVVGQDLGEVYLAATILAFCRKFCFCFAWNGCKSICSFHLVLVKNKYKVCKCRRHKWIHQRHKSILASGQWKQLSTYQHAHVSYFAPLLLVNSPNTWSKSTNQILALWLFCKLGNAIDRW